MGIWMAALLAAAAASPQESALPRSLSDEDEASVGIIAAVRAGVWTGHGFNFQAVRSDSTQATSKQELLFSASLLGGLQFSDHFVLLGSYESDVASKISAEVGGGFVGWRERPKERYGKGVPDEVLLYAGVLVGRFEVHQTGFGGFDRGTGFGGGVGFGWILSPRATIQLFGEYRYLRFEYRRDVVSGDESIGGNSAWFGLGFDYRF